MVNMVTATVMATATAMATVMVIQKRKVEILLSLFSLRDSYPSKKTVDKFLSCADHFSFVSLE